MRSWLRGRRRDTAAPPGAAVVGAPIGGGASPVQPGLPDADVVVVSRAGCHLCEVAEQVAAPVAERHGASLAVVDVDREPAWRERWGDHVPVVLVRGVLLDYWHVDGQRLDDALSGRPVTPPPGL